MEKVTINLLYKNGEKEKFIVNATSDSLEEVVNVVKVCLSEGVNAHITLPVGNTVNIINVKDISRFTLEIIEEERSIGDVYNDFRPEVSN